MDEIVTLDEAKRALRVTHDLDDELIEELIDDAQDEALNFLDLSGLPVMESDSAPVDSPGATDFRRSFRRAVILLVQGWYDEQDAAKLKLYRERAETLLFPYRRRLGV